MPEKVKKGTSDLFFVDVCVSALSVLVCEYVWVSVCMCVCVCVCVCVWDAVFCWPACVISLREPRQSEYGPDNWNL